MRRASPVTHSPYADVPLSQLTPEEQYDRYHTRTPESFVPYTVDEVLRSVYHRDYQDDLSDFLNAGVRCFRTLEGDLWNVSSVVVMTCRFVSTESILGQSLCSFLVDQVVEAKLRWNLLDRATGRRHKTEFSVDHLRLRYCFNFHPDTLSCDFIGVIRDDSESLFVMYPEEIRLNEFLLPVMVPEDYSFYADTLRLTLLKLAPDEDVALDPRQLLYALDLRVYQGAFEDEDILGEYFFNHGSARVMDPESGMPARLPMDPGSVVISNLIDSSGLYASTVVHECAHRLLGTPFFMLQKTHGHKYCSYMSKLKGKKPGDEKKQDPLALLEEQADLLPGYLLIPSELGKLHARRLFRSYGKGSHRDLLLRLVRDMASFYGTTKTMACRRLIDFGYTDLVDIIRRNRVIYRVSEQEAMAEFVRNAAFRESLSCGEYVYADGVFCLDLPRYLSRDPSGTPHLTPWAAAHLSECCLPFRRHASDPEKEPGNAVCKTLGHTHSIVEFAAQSGKVPTTSEGTALRQKLEAMRRDELRLSESFNAMTCRLMKERGVTMEKLAERSGLSIGTIRNLRTDPCRFFEIEVIVAFCIALHLPPRVSQLYVAASPAKFLETTDMRLYQYMMLNCYDLPMPVVNRKLIEAGAPPLTSLIEGFDLQGKTLA